jgi:hypothetical protein
MGSSLAALAAVEGAPSLGAVLGLAPDEHAEATTAIPASSAAVRVLLNRI